ncbi:hypothetical protein [Actinoplanes sp. CA-252034]|uniref:hypothetical protein n=1 Tax=Actinoplanes sp. CA-252034 TaxID=3239906 RepID=UPI003D95DA58
MTPHPATGAPAADAAGATRPVPSRPSFPDTAGSDVPGRLSPDTAAPGSSSADATRPGSSPDGVARIVGVSLGHATLAEADHWIQSLVPAPVLACTHLVSEPFPHVAISLLTARAVETAPGLAVAAALAEAGSSGRAVRFPGVERLTGSLTVSEILQRSSIARVEVLGSGQAPPDTVVETGDFVRPQFRDGELILVTTPAAGGTLVPFETRTPTPCCADH